MRKPLDVVRRGVILPGGKGGRGGAENGKRRGKLKKPVALPFRSPSPVFPNRFSGAIQPFRSAVGGMPTTIEAGIDKVKSHPSRLPTDR